MITPGEIVARRTKHGAMFGPDERYIDGEIWHASDADEWPARARYEYLCRPDACVDYYRKRGWIVEDVTGDSGRHLEFHRP